MPASTKDQPDGPDRRRLDDLSRRLDAARGERETDAEKAATASARGRSLGAGFRLASELMAAVLVGLALGLGADFAFDVSPFGLLAGLFIGFAAGLRNAAAAMTAGQNDAGGGADKEKRSGEDDR